MSIESTINCPVSKRPRRFSSRIGLHFGPDGSRSKMINETIDSLMKGDKQFRSKSSALQENFIYQKSLKIYAYLSIRMRHNPSGKMVSVAVIYKIKDF
ncbi:hypothetical protein BpHYR1_002059 [Brachionus plicatilis]|uniref:Uncharacterized protein n=1 Tax=Brachionus plicatilis TaxID=10195 RepID=A0A3M7QYS5_BRAPC|nr:hypothetical protein BpHYR1_002059 [Brachionus plicatilis]